MELDLGQFGKIVLQAGFVNWKKILATKGDIYRYNDTSTGAVAIYTPSDRCVSVATGVTKCGQYKTLSRHGRLISVVAGEFERNPNKISLHGLQLELMRVITVNSDRWNRLAAENDDLDAVVLECTLKVIALSRSNTIGGVHCSMCPVTSDALGILAHWLMYHKGGKKTADAVRKLRVRGDEELSEFSIAMEFTNDVAKVMKWLVISDKEMNNIMKVIDMINEEVNAKELGRMEEVVDDGDYGVDFGSDGDEDYLRFIASSCNMEGVQMAENADIKAKKLEAVPEVRVSIVEGSDEFWEQLIELDAKMRRERAIVDMRCKLCDKLFSTRLQIANHCWNQHKDQLKD